MFTSEQLLREDFDVNAYLRYALHTSGASNASEQARLATCMEEAKQNIQNILATHADDMIAQVSNVHRAQREVVTVRQSISSLAKTTSRLRLMIDEPFRMAQSRLRELEHTNEAMEVLRKVTQFLTVVARLREQAASGDLLRVARTVQEAEDDLEDASLRGLEVVEEQVRFIQTTAAGVKARAHELLSMPELLRASGDPAAAGGSSGISQAAVDVATALHCFCILRCLPRVVAHFMAERKREVVKVVMRELDPQLISSSIERGTPAGGDRSSAALLQRTQEAVLGHVQRALYLTLQQTHAVLLLWRVLLRRRPDAAGQPNFRAALESPAQLLVDFWSSTADRLRERLLGIQKQPNVQAALTAGYPRYHLLLESFVSTTGSVRPGASSEGTFEAVGVRESGVGDLLDLISVVETGPGEAEASSHAAVDAATRRLQHGWLTQVEEVVRHRFTTQVMDRHRERVSTLLARLHAMIPTTPSAGGQAAAVTPVDLRRPAVPPQANALELKLYTQLMLQDIYAHQESPHSLRLILDCVLQCVRQLTTKLEESARRLPLPPLPCVTAAPTRTQLLHICITNGATHLLHGLANVLALLPGDVDPACGPTPASRASSPLDAKAITATVAEGCRDADPRALLCTQRTQLREVMRTLQQVAEASSRPFACSASAAFVTSVSACVVSACSTAMPATVAQLQSQVDFFLTRFYFLFEPRTPAWAESTRRTADTLLAHLLACVSLSGLPADVPESDRSALPAPDDTRRALQRCLSAVVPVAEHYMNTTAAGGLGRSTLLLKGAAGQMEVLYRAWQPSHAASAEDGTQPPQQQQAAEEIASVLRPLPPLLIRLLVLQQLELDAGQHVVLPTPATVLELRPEAMIELVQQALLQTCGAVPLEGEVLREVMQAAQTCYDLITHSQPAPPVVVSLWRLAGSEAEGQTALGEKELRECSRAAPPS